MAGEVKAVFDLAVEVNRDDDERGLSSFERKLVTREADKLWRKVDEHLLRTEQFVDTKGAEEPDDPRLPELVERLTQETEDLVEKVTTLRREVPARAAQREAQQVKALTELPEQRRKVQGARLKAQAQAIAQLQQHGSSAAAAADPRAVTVSPAIMDNFKENFDTLAELVQATQAAAGTTRAQACTTQIALEQQIKKPHTELEKLILQEKEREFSTRKRTSPESSGEAAAAAAAAGASSSSSSAAAAAAAAAAAGGGAAATDAAGSAQLKMHRAGAEHTSVRRNTLGLAL